jgi:catechol 2,3-dioxygenase-like lactoylglutathione lyase family enzyme
MPNESKPIDPRVRIGHVHLKVADLERALNFYCGVLGFELIRRFPRRAPLHQYPAACPSLRDSLAPT